MSEGTELVEQLFGVFQEALDQGDPARVFESGLVSDDLEWLPIREWPGPESYRGRDGFADFMRTWTEDFEKWSIHAERVIDAGNHRVVGLVHQDGIGRGSGVQVALDIGTIFELADGQVVRIRNYADVTEALEAAGLSE